MGYLLLIAFQEPWLVLLCVEYNRRSCNSIGHPGDRFLFCAFAFLLGDSIIYLRWNLGYLSVVIMRACKKCMIRRLQLRLLGIGLWFRISRQRRSVLIIFFVPSFSWCFLNTIQTVDFCFQRSKVHSSLHAAFLCAYYQFVRNELQVYAVQLEWCKELILPGFCLCTCIRLWFYKDLGTTRVFNVVQGRRIRFRRLEI